MDKCGKHGLYRGINCIYRNECAVVFSFFEFNNPISERVQSKIFSNSDIFARMINSTTLTKDDVAGDHRLATKYFHTKALAVRIATILYTAFAFFMCHDVMFKFQEPN